jgi:hypothetical protein
MSEFPLGTAQKVCKICQKELVYEEPFFSTVQLSSESSSEAIVRFEFCLVCWELEQNQGVYWKNKMKALPPEKAPPPDFTVLWELFLESRQKAPLLHYFLALVLMRRKQLDFIRTVKIQGQEYLVFRPKGKQKRIRVPDLAVYVQELEKIQEELRQKLPEVTF